ncbi:Protein of unknown function [Gryllus bimaculatus]|nr:Protein of unknown function [Gryllus bimaculatus]
MVHFKCKSRLFWACLLGSIVIADISSVNKIPSNEQEFTPPTDNILVLSSVNPGIKEIPTNEEEKTLRTHDPPAVTSSSSSKFPETTPHSPEIVNPRIKEINKQEESTQRTYDPIAVTSSSSSKFPETTPHSREGENKWTWLLIGMVLVAIFVAMFTCPLLLMWQAATSAL